jgi:predicted anti-sigma-YlaC factor YlaD
MNCNEYIDGINMLLDGALDESTQISLFSHLKDCTECRMYFDTMLRVRQISATEQIPFPEEIDRIVLSNIRKESVKSTRSFWNWSIRISAPIAAAVILAIASLAIISGIISASKERERIIQQERLTSGSKVVHAYPVYVLPPIEIVAEGDKINDSVTIR